MANLIKNGGFEEREKDWEGFEGNIVSDEKYSGSYSAYNPAIRQVFDAEPFETYYLRFRYKTIYPDTRVMVKIHPIGKVTEIDIDIIIIRTSEDTYEYLEENIEMLYDKPLSNGWREFLGKFATLTLYEDYPPKVILCYGWLR